MAPSKEKMTMRKELWDIILTFSSEDLRSAARSMVGDNSNGTETNAIFWQVTRVWVLRE